MKSHYNRIYKDLYNQYIDEFYDDRYRSRVSKYFRRRFRDEDEYYYLQEDFMQMIENEMDKMETYGNIRLRGDAKLFLLTNFHQMIIRPLLLASISQKTIPPLLRRNKLIEMVRADIQAVVEFSREDSNEEEISGHSIMRSIDKMWGKLNSAKFEIWG